MQTGVPYRVFSRIRIIACVAVLVYGTPAFALESEGDVAGVHYEIYAPDWTWQGRDANIMAVFENRTDATASCAVSLIISEEYRDHFGRNGAAATPETSPLVEEIAVAPGETRRIALTGLTALHGFPRQTYPLILSIRVNETATSVDYPLRTIRGQAVSEGRAVALGVPIGVALLFSAAFAFVLRRTGNPDAWKIVPEPTPEPDQLDSWINQIPK